MSKQKPASIRVLLCCNDPDNGEFEGRICGIEIGDLKLDSLCEPGPKLFYSFAEPAFIRIAGKKFPIEGHGSWVGNWCWDSVSMAPKDVLRLLNWPRFWKFFQVEEAPEKLFEIAQSFDREFTEADLELL